MHDMDTTKRMFTHMINMMEQHDTMTISCGDPLMELLKDVRELLKDQDNCENCAIAIEDRQPVVRCKDCIWFHKPDAETKKSCKCNYHGCKTKEDRYCWWGEKDA